MTTISLTERSRTDLKNQMEHIRLWAWQAQQTLDESSTIDADQVIRLLGAVIDGSKQVDRKIKARRRAAIKKAEAAS